MATTTPNFGWSVPTSTDLVKDGATAIETLGDSIDASLVDLKGGTSGQVLSKNSNTDMDFTWVTSDDANAIQNAIVDAKGDLIAATAADTPARLAVGTNGQILTADSTAATGLKWAAASSGAMAFINRTSFSAVASQTFDSVFSSTYDTYLIVAENLFCSTGVNDVQFQWRYSSSTENTGYYGTSARFTSSTTYTQSNNTAEFTIADQIGTSSQPGSFSAWVTNAGQTSENPAIHGTGNEGQTPGGVFVFGCFQFTARTYTGFILKTPSGTMTGDVSIYGLVKA
jgi:hypothetical protein